MIATENIPLKDFKRLGIEPLKFSREYESSMQSLLRGGRTDLISLKLRLIDNSVFEFTAKLEFEKQNEASPSLVVIQPKAQLHNQWKLNEEDLVVLVTGKILVKTRIGETDPFYLYQHDPLINDIVRVNASNLPVPITPSNLKAIANDGIVSVGERIFHICLWKPNFVK